MKTISIVTACFNEEENVEELYRRVREAVRAMGRYRYEHIFIDNNSSDGTVTVLKRIARADHNVKVIVNARNFGHVRSPMHALMETRGDAVIGIVADLQDPPEMIQEMIKKWEEGFSMVLCVKSSSEENRVIFWIRKRYYAWVQRLSAIETFQNFTGFGLYDRKVIEAVRSFADPYPYFRGIIAEIGLPHAELFYEQRRRSRGKTKNNLYTLYDVAMLAITNLSKVPLRFVTVLGFVCSLLCLAVGSGYFIYKLMFWSRFTVGIAPLVIGLFFLGSVQLLSMGILGEYIGAIHTNVQRRPVRYRARAHQFRVRTRRARRRAGDRCTMMASLDPRQRACPICGSLQSRVLFQQRFERLSGIELLSGYDVVVCVHCGLAFADGIPDQADLDTYYRELSKYEYVHNGGEASALDERRFQEIAATIARYVPASSSRVTEIGCATGRLLSVLRNAGFDSVQGVDPSPGCARAAWELYGVPVLVGSMSHLPVPEASSDFVILIGVLEHVADVRGAMSHLRRILTPNGRVYAEVPDAANLAGRPDAPYQEFSNEHINFFSAASLANLFRVMGFEVVMTGETIRQQHDNTTYPAAFGVFAKALVPTEFTPDAVTEQGLRRYIEESGEIDIRTRQRIERAAGREPVIVWGTGTHTQRLLATGAFKNVRIVAFVDSNPKYHGRELHGIPVVSPSAIPGREEPIVISTRGFQSEIQDQIRRQLKINNEIILLYP